MDNLSKSELVLLNNALNEILHGPDAIPEAEFQTRTGTSPKEAKELLDKIVKCLGSIDK